MKRPLLRQTWVVSAALINMLGQGMMLGYPTSLVPALLDPNSSIKTDLNTAAWLASSVGLTSALGAVISSMLMYLIGRKLTHLICTIPGLIGWLCIYLARNIPTIMFGRVLGGFSAGAGINTAAIVIGEFTSPKYRGVFLNMKNAAFCAGSTFLHIISFYMSWRDITLVALAPHIIALVMTVTWPESPAWLASRHQYERSEQSFYWLRGRDEASKKEIYEMITDQIENTKRERKTSPTWLKISEFFCKFIRKDFLKPLITACIGFLLVETCGRHYFMAYALQIIGKITDAKSESFYYIILGLDIIITASIFLSSVLVKKMTRRTLLFSTGFSAVAVLAVVCIYLYLVSLDVISKERSLIPISLLVVYFILTNLACTSIPLALLGELFPLAHRGVSSAISGIFIALFILIFLQMTPLLLVALNVHGMFAIFGAFMALSLVLLYLLLPETKDKTLQEIENYYRYGKYEKVSVIDKDDEACSLK